jgi:hypothetical protein
MIRCLIIKILLFCRLSSGVHLCSVHGPLYGAQRAVYEGVYTVGEHGGEIYYPTWVAA